jgi:hypothetical protein
MSDTGKSPPKWFVDAHGDPELWAKSTLPEDDTTDLVVVFQVKKGTLIGNEPIKNRMWLHDLLDDNEIPYRIEHAGDSAQFILVKNEQKDRAIDLIIRYNISGNTAQELASRADAPGSPAKPVKPVKMADGVAQVRCPSCSEYIDFDHHTCPRCKAALL